MQNYDFFLNFHSSFIFFNDLCRLFQNKDGDGCALATVLMFNLYGMPMLHVRLRNIVELTRGSQKSLRFEYKSGTGLIKKRSWAFADELGNVKDVVHFK